VQIAGDIVATRQLANFTTAGCDQGLTKSAAWVWPSDCHLRDRDPHMVLKIEKVSDGPNVLLRLSGRIESQQVQELKVQIDGSEKKFVLDLEQVRLVDLDAVHFLAVCETKGIELRHCPPYVREWIRSEKPRISDGMRKTD
jgi:hypothetical protein